MVNALFVAIIESLAKHKRRMLDGIETALPETYFIPVRKKILRELGRDEFEKEVEQIIKQFAERQGKGK